MTNADWTTCWQTFGELWPRYVEKLTDEEQASYRRVLGWYPWTQVQTAMRGHKDAVGKFPMAWEVAKRIPKPEASTGKRDGGNVTWQSQVRDRWAKASPEHRQRIEDLSDHEIEVAQAHGEWEGCEAVYGAGESSFAAWRRWQRLVGNTDEVQQMRDDYKRVTDALDYEQLRERWNAGRMATA